MPEGDQLGESALDTFDDVLEGPGFVMARKGRYIIMNSTRSEEEHRAILRRLASLGDGLRESVEHDVQALESVLVQFDPLDVIANMSLLNSVMDPETYKEYSHEGRHPYVEYVALLFLTRSVEEYPQAGERLISGEIIEDIQRRVEEIFHKTMWILATAGIDSKREKPSGAMRELRFETIGRSLMVRYPAYHHHLVELLHGLLTLFDSELLQQLGFSATDALTLINGIAELQTRHLVDRRQQARRQEKSLRRAAKRYRQKRRVSDGFPRDLLEQLAAMRPSESAARIRNLTTAWTFFALGDTLSFVSSDLANETGIPEDRVDCFIERMSLTFGEVESRYRLPSPTHPLMTRPLVRHRRGCLCPLVQLAYSSLRPAIEEYLNPDVPPAVTKDSRIWDHYVQARAEYVEARAIDYLANALQHAHVHRNLKYSVAEDGETREAELDGLIILDTALFLIEVKAGSLSAPARRGAPKRMLRDIESLLQEAYRQALRAKRYISECHRATFRTRDGTEVAIDKNDFRHMFLITVTLEPMDAFSTTIYQLQEIGFFEEGDLPWAVSLTDLRVISELAEFPSQLVHYLMRRQRLNQSGRVSAHDELDWFGHYLCEGLFFDKMLESGAFVRLLSYTTPLDDYYSYITGQRETPAPKPAQPMPQAFREIISDLECTHPRTYLDAAVAMLEMGEPERTDFAGMAVSQRERSIRDRQLHDFSLLFSQAGFGITYMFAPIERLEELDNKLGSYCRIKKYQTKVDLWVGLGCVVDTAGWADMGISLSAPWQYSPEMDAIVRDMPPPQQRTSLSSFSSQ